MIKIIKGNIFNTKCQVLVNTVNCEGIMGKGMALESKYRFPEMYDNYENCCKQGQLKPGMLILWQKSNPWILNFPTKVLWKNDSKIEYINQGLNKFIEIYESKNITSIAFPMLGASLGGLQENVVEDVMVKYLKKIEDKIEIEIYKYDKDTRDELFDKFVNMTQGYCANDYKSNLKITTVAAQNLHDAIKNKKSKSMLGLQDIEQIGNRTIEKIHIFVKKEKKGTQEILSFE